ncbi:hypothetical protein B1B_13741, partial [mine drainage metagenome]
MKGILKAAKKKTPIWRRLSAGLITGAADDDPSGIATYSLVGAAYGYATLWTVGNLTPCRMALRPEHPPAS